MLKLIISVTAEHLISKIPTLETSQEKSRAILKAWKTLGVVPTLDMDKLKGESETPG